MARIMTVHHRSRGYARLGPIRTNISEVSGTSWSNAGYERTCRVATSGCDIPPQAGAFPGTYTNILGSCRSSAAGGWNLNWVQNLDPDTIRARPQILPSAGSFWPAATGPRPSFPLLA